MKNEELYKSAVLTYLTEQLALDQYDQELSESPLHFIPAPSDSVTSPLKYFRIMNKIYCERLSSEDQAVIEAAGEEDEKITEIAVRTFAQTVSAIPIEKLEDKKILTYYSENEFSKPDFVTVDSVVVEIRTSYEYDETGTIVSFDHEVEKEAALREIAKQMETELDGSLGDVPIRILAGFAA